MTMIPVPESERSPLLAEVLSDLAEATRLLFRNQYQLGIMADDLFANAMGQWFIPDDLSAKEINDVEQRKKRLVEVGFDGDRLKTQLKRLFESDPHLSSCCKTVWGLTRFLSKHFLSYVVGDDSKEDFETTLKIFSDFLYCEPYRVFAVYHLFNFDAELDKFEINGTIFNKFSRRDAFLVFENEIVFNLFYAEGAGDFFAYREVVGAEQNIEEFGNQLRRTHDIVIDSVGVLQFVSDGLVHIDYNFLSYKPKWVNKLYPPHPVGTPRKFPHDEGRSFYLLTSEDVDTVRTWANIWNHESVQKRLEESSNLGNLVRLAIELYTSSFYQTDEAQRLLHLTFALEALFSPSDNQELSFRIRQYGSQFVGITEAERNEIYGIVKKAYASRSKLVHGSLDVSAYIDDTLTTAADNTALASVVRRSILRMLVLLFRGRDNLKNHTKDGCIHRELEMSALNPQVAEALRRESNPEEFVETFVM